MFKFGVMSKVTALYHIVFCTRMRQYTIPMDMREDLYRFIWSEIKQVGCRLIRIGGIQNHVHMLIDLHPSVPLATLMQNVKGRSSVWMHEDRRFPNFEGWAGEYFGCTLSPEQKSIVCEYINSQVAHHSHADLKDELQHMYRYADLEYNDNDMM